MSAQEPQAPNSAKPVIFLSHAHADSGPRQWLTELSHLLETRCYALDIETFLDHRSLPLGCLFDQDIDDALNRTVIGVAWLTTGLIASEYVRRVELPTIERRAEAGLAQLVPVLAQPCDWRQVNEVRCRSIARPFPAALSDLTDSERLRALDSLAAEIQELAAHLLRPRPLVAQAPPHRSPPPLALELVTEVAGLLRDDDLSLSLEARQRRQAVWALIERDFAVGNPRTQPAAAIATALQSVAQRDADARRRIVQLHVATRPSDPPASPTGTEAHIRTTVEFRL